MTKDQKYWKTFNYYLMVYGDESSAHVITEQELGYTPEYNE